MGRREIWKPIEHFEGYSVSNLGNVRTDRSGRILVQSFNQYGLCQVGMMKDGKQHHRSVPLLVASAFIDQPLGPFDTPINLDGDRGNNCVDNLVWRPRWFAVRYNQQFKYPWEFPIELPIQNMATGEISPNSFACAKKYGLLEKDLVLSISARTVVWPIYQEFRVVED